MIIGITGTLGAGKGAIVEYLKRRGFQAYSVREFLTQEIADRGLPINRDTMVAVANELRDAHGSGYIVQSLYDTAAAVGGDAVIESIRTMGEVEILQGKPGCILLAVDADPALRYERIRERASATDAVTWEHFLADEKREFENPDPAKQNLKACIAAADVVIQNNGTLEQLEEEVERVLVRG